MRDGADISNVVVKEKFLVDLRFLCWQMFYGCCEICVAFFVYRGSRRLRVLALILWYPLYQHVYLDIVSFFIYDLLLPCTFVAGLG